MKQSEVKSFVGRYESFVVMGHTFKDCTSYSQRSTKPPNCWNTRILRTVDITVLRRDYGWFVRSNDLGMDWTEVRDTAWDSVDVRDASRNALLTVASWLHRVRVAILEPSNRGADLRGEAAVTNHKAGTA